MQNEPRRRSYQSGVKNRDWQGAEVTGVKRVEQDHSLSIRE